MAGYLVKNAQPRGYALGIKDDSRSAPASEAITTPQFFPFFFTLAEKSYDEAITISGNRDQVLGKKSFKKDSPYYTHANAFVKKLTSKVNQLVVETIKLPGSAKAFLRVSVEVVPTDIPQYKRISDSTKGQIGQYEVDALGSRILEGTVRGTELVIHTGLVNAVGQERLFGGAVNKTCRAADALVDGKKISQLTLDDGKTVVSSSTTIYTLFDLEINYYGKTGDLAGIRIYNPTTEDGNGPSILDMKKNRALPYRFMSVEKESENASAEPVEILTGDAAIDLCLKPSAISVLSEDPIALARAFVPAYSKKASISGGAVYGNWGRVKVYEQQLETLLSILAGGYTVAAGGQMVDINGEGDFDTDPIISQVRDSWAMLEDPANIHLINLFTGADYNGIPYGSISVDNTVNYGGITFDNATSHFATGGGDGLYYYADGRPATEVNAKLFDDAVRARLRGFGQGINKYRDALKYPISCMVDSGFTLETKLEMTNILRQRPDMYVIPATHAIYDIGKKASPDVRSIYRDGNVDDVDNISQLIADWGLCGQQTMVEEDGYGMAIKAAFSAIVESEYYNTQTVRAIIRGQSGRVIEPGIWDGHLPMTYEFMCQLSDLAGASNGIWRPEYDFTIQPNNMVQLMDELNNTYRENNSYTRLWDIGVVWSSAFDQFRYYTPVVQTVYPHDDSVLNSGKFMIACCRLEYLSLIVHASLVGRDDLTDDEFIQASKKKSEELVDGIFAGKYVVNAAPEIYESDRKKGFIWRNFYHIYGNVMKSAMIYGIIAKRMSDYTGTK